jgi:hypothetical protein
MTHSRAHPCRLAASISAVPAPVPLLAHVQGESLALPPVLPRHVRNHPRQLPADGLGDPCRIVQGMDQFLQPGRTQTVVPGQERPGRSLVSGLPRTDLHRINVTARPTGQN